MKIIQPTIEWYEGISREKGVTPRCPYTNVHRCPRYYFSLSLTGQAGISTTIDKGIDEELHETWKKHELYPVTGEQDTMTGTNTSGTTLFSNYCPEVSYDIFGFFATYLHRYTDEIDRELAHKQLKQKDVASGDWRWAWQHLEPQHFIHCQLYSLLQGSQFKQQILPLTTDEERSEPVLNLMPSIWGMSVNLHELWRRFKSWRKKSNKPIQPNRLGSE